MESQNDYECECNKDFVAYQNENERLKEILSNAIRNFEFDEYEHGAILQHFNMTEEEYNKYIGE